MTLSLLYDSFPVFRASEDVSQKKEAHLDDLDIRKIAKESSESYFLKQARISIACMDETVSASKKNACRTTVKKSKKQSNN